MQNLAESTSCCVESVLIERPVREGTKKNMNLNTHTKNLDEYKEIVRDLNQNMATDIFSNKKPEHAAAIFAEFFKSATNSVVIFCKNLSQEVYAAQEIPDLLQLALSRGVNVEFLCQEKPESQGILNLRSPNLTISRSTSEEVINSESNFAVMDGRAFRWEINNKEAQAIACMNKPKVCRHLVDAFKSYKNKGSEVIAPA